MSKTIKLYTPGQNDFLHFAEVMNMNANIDFKQTQAQKANPVALHNAQSAPTPNAEESAASAANTLYGTAENDRILNGFKRTINNSKYGIGANNGGK